MEEQKRQVIFGKYEMGRLLGKGTFAKVYFAKNIQTGESVAIKIIGKEEVKRESCMMEQIKREISVMRLVRHPNIVELKEVMATRTRIFFVMEHVKGGELFAKVEKGRLKEEKARKYFQQLISAIDYCHSRGVSHRDLKPENLLLDEYENLKISDFGLSALPEQLRHDGLLHTQCGTPAYVAPEVLRRKGYDGSKADIWSCGVILYVLLAGYLPFQDENIMKMYRKIYKSEFEFPPWISTDAKRLISRMLVADPDRRITIPAIMRNPWFQKGFSRPIAFDIDEADVISTDNPNPEINNNTTYENDSNSAKTKKAPSPKFFNAFVLVSSLSSGLDLSNLFEHKRKSTSIFTSKRSAAAIVAAIEAAARAMKCRVRKLSDFKLKLQGAAEGRKGRLAVTAEVFELAAEVAVVELSKEAGDTLEYVKFCEEEVRPALKDIVWTWQGDDINNNINIKNDKIIDDGGVVNRG
uniref:non-specific serine/threonine protein kinase n=1 Tax=Kalanchoe fedtschenkoi TaxID=63787 RepID=A0A7N0ZZ58_KALFE